MVNWSKSQIVLATFRRFALAAGRGLVAKFWYLSNFCHSSFRLLHSQCRWYSFVLNPCRCHWVEASQNQRYFIVHRRLKIWRICLFLSWVLELCSQQYCMKYVSFDVIFSFRSVYSDKNGIFWNGLSSPAVFPVGFFSSLLLCDSTWRHSMPSAYNRISGWSSRATYWRESSCSTAHNFESFLHIASVNFEHGFVSIRFEIDWKVSQAGWMEPFIFPYISTCDNLK